MTKHIFINPKETDGLDAPFGPLGSLIDIRTYRRWLPDKKRRETMAERNARVVNYNCNLATENQDTESLQKEANKMYELLNSLKVWPSGRTAWVGGTPSTEKNPSGNFNCSFTAINRLGAFTDLFELLMQGCGVGFRVHDYDINQLPRILNIPRIKFDAYSPKASSQRTDSTVADVSSSDPTVYRVIVGDSRQGWIDSLTCLFSIVFEETPIETIEFNFDSVRPMGERIKGFGGTASGPDALRGIISDVLSIIEEVPLLDTSTEGDLFFVVLIAWTLPVRLPQAS